MVKILGRKFINMAINKRLISMLVCPLSKEKLIYDEDKQELIAKKSGLAYPVKDGIPIMLPEEARKIKK
jgi:uncharacterized protein YbaR (Trm112 family)